MVFVSYHRDDRDTTVEDPISYAVTLNRAKVLQVGTKYSSSLYLDRAGTCYDNRSAQNLELQGDHNDLAGNMHSPDAFGSFSSVDGKRIRMWVHCCAEETRLRKRFR